MTGGQEDRRIRGWLLAADGREISNLFSLPLTKGEREGV